MNGLLSKEEDALAASQGWGLHHVYDMDVSQWVIRVLPAPVQTNVINAARQGNPLAIKALRLMTHGPEGKK